MMPFYRSCATYVSRLYIKASKHAGFYKVVTPDTLVSRYHVDI